MIETSRLKYGQSYFQLNDPKLFWEENFDGKEEDIKTFVEQVETDFNSEEELKPNQKNALLAQVFCTNKLHEMGRRGLKINTSHSILIRFSRESSW